PPQLGAQTSTSAQPALVPPTSANADDPRCIGNETKFPDSRMSSFSRLADSVGAAVGPRFRGVAACSAEGCVIRVYSATVSVGSSALQVLRKELRPASQCE